YAEKAWAAQQISELRATLDDGLGRLKEGPRYAERAWAERELSELRASLDDGLGRLQEMPEYAEKAWAAQQISELRASAESCASRVEELASSRVALNGDGPGCSRQLVEVQASVADQRRQMETLTEEFEASVASLTRALQGVQEKLEGWRDPTEPLEVLTAKVSSLEGAAGTAKNRCPAASPGGSRIHDAALAST
ncbi:unnamed protein product, partial [Prorocentrum cordatum]